MLNQRWDILNTAFPERLKSRYCKRQSRVSWYHKTRLTSLQRLCWSVSGWRSSGSSKKGKIKKDKHESVIFRRDNSHYEKLDSVERCIDDELPFEIPGSWAWAYFGNISFVTKLAGFEYTKYIAPALTNHGIPLFKGKNIQNGKLIEHFEGFIPETVSNELWRSQLSKRCLLTPLYVGSIGNVAGFFRALTKHISAQMLGK